MPAPRIVTDASEDMVARWLAECIARALAGNRARVAICLPGGSTPFPILERLRSCDLDWSRIDVWPGDDRIVPESHPASNAGRLRALLEPSGARVLALSEEAKPPHFALTWLGMGADGHVASLFPSADPRADDPRKVIRLVPEPLPPEAPYARLSLTIPALLDCAEVLFVIRGADKRALFETAARGGSDLPVSQLLSAATRPVTCFAM